MVTTEAKKHIPYTRQVSTVMKFQAAVSLTKLHVEDVPDSRCKSSDNLLFWEISKYDDAFWLKFCPQFWSLYTGLVKKVQVFW